MLQGEHSAILSTFLKVPLVINILVFFSIYIKAIFNSGIFPYFCRLLIFFKIIFCFRFYFRNTTMLNSLKPDQARHFVGPDLGPNLLQNLGRRQKSPLEGKELTLCILKTLYWCFGKVRGGGGGGRGCYDFFLIRMHRPGIYCLQQKISRISGIPQKLFQILATPQKTPILHLDLKKDPKMHRYDPKT